MKIERDFASPALRVHEETPLSVIPAKAGTQSGQCNLAHVLWVPAFAGMTEGERISGTSSKRETIYSQPLGTAICDIGLCIVLLCLSSMYGCGPSNMDSAPTIPTYSDAGQAPQKYQGTLRDYLLAEGYLPKLDKAFALLDASLEDECERLPTPSDCKTLCLRLSNGSYVHLDPQWKVDHSKSVLCWVVEPSSDEFEGKTYGFVLLIDAETGERQGGS
jgi:hypothetical protein